MNQSRTAPRASGNAAFLAASALVLAVACQGDMDDDLEGTSQAAQARVTICHRGETITVAEAAVPAHLRHGDTVGACDEEDAGVEADAGVDAGAEADAGVVVPQ